MGLNKLHSLDKTVIQLETMYYFLLTRLVVRERNIPHAGGTVPKKDKELCAFSDFQHVITPPLIEIEQINILSRTATLIKLSKERKHKHPKEIKTVLGITR